MGSNWIRLKTGLKSGNKKKNGCDEQAQKVIIFLFPAEPHGNWEADSTETGKREWLFRWVVDAEWLLGDLNGVGGEKFNIHKPPLAPRKGNVSRNC